MKGNVMNFFIRHSRALIAILVVIAESAYAQQPPDTVASDGFGNTASGTAALLTLEPTQTPHAGSMNSAYGYATLTKNVSGNFNTAVGNGALYKNTASDNTAVGGGALYNNTVAADNTAVGYAALYFNASGGSNTAVGAAA